MVKVWDKGFIGKDFEGMAYIPLMRLNPGITKARVCRVLACLALVLAATGWGAFGARFGLPVLRSTAWSNNYPPPTRPIPPQDAWYDLTPRPNKSKDRVSGQVHIRLHFTPEGGTTRCVVGFGVGFGVAGCLWVLMGALLRVETNLQHV